MNGFLPDIFQHCFERISELFQTHLNFIFFENLRKIIGINHKKIVKIKV